jgi:tRNA 5-methylaminomethyl-2-thiouridine biosynthesis bifunctional protein
VRHTWQAARAHLRTGLDWLPCGVLEHRLHGRAGVPAQDGPSPASAEHGFSREADPSQKQALGLSPQAPVTWHPYAGWIKPAELTKALLKHPLIEFQGHCEVKALVQGTSTQWLALDQLGNTLAEAHWVIVAGGPFSRSLMPPDIAPGMALDAVRGQLTWGETDKPSGWPPVPVNGHGSLIAQVPQTDRPGQAWFAGATFDRSPDQPDWSDLAQLNRPVPTTATDTQHNLQKLKALWPATESHHLDAPQAPPLQAWASIRCTSADRLPWVGPIDPEHQAGLWLCTAMGARGLSWALLCAELLACWACGEPLPLEASHARALLAYQKTN